MAARTVIDALHLDEEDVELAIQETNLAEAVTAALAVRDEAEALLAGIKARREALDIRAERIARQKQRIDDALATALELAGLKTLKLPEATVTLAAGVASARVIDESVIPAEFWIVKTVQNLDKRALTAALKLGTPVPGAELSNAPDNLRVKKS